MKYHSNMFALIFLEGHLFLASFETVCEVLNSKFEHIWFYCLLKTYAILSKHNFFSSFQDS